MRDIDNLTNLKNFLEVNNTYIDLILTTLASFLLNYLEKRMDSESSMKDFCSQEGIYGNNYSNSTSPETFWKS